MVGRGEPDREERRHNRRPLASARRMGRVLTGGSLVMISLAFVTLSGTPAQADSSSLLTWSQANGSANGCTTTCPASPTPRAADPVVYDEATAQVMLFGGLGAGFTSLNDTWSWNGTAWTQVADSGDAGCTTTCTAGPPPVLRPPWPTTRRASS